MSPKKKSSCCTPAGCTSGAGAGGAGESSAVNTDNLDAAQVAQIKQAMELLQLQKAKEAAAAAKTTEDASKKPFKFWSTQPVPKIDEEVTTNEAITPNIPPEDLRHEPFSLPADFQWDTLNIDDPLVVCPLIVGFVLVPVLNLVDF